MNQQLFFDHFERLTDAPGSVPRLRELILQLAVQGKLVPQYPHEESAAGLLARLDDERRRLIKQKKLSETNPLPPVTVDEMPYEIPENWQWVRLGWVADYCLGKMLDKHKNKGTPLPYLRNVNVRWFDFDLSDVLEMRFEDDELERFGLEVGDVLICEGGEPGRAAIWDGRVPGMKFQKAIHRVRPSSVLYNRFLVYLLFLEAKTGTLARHFTGATIKHFTGQKLALYTFALPPLEEQKRIVAKVDELMELCDELERVQTERREARQRLNRAALDQLLAARDAAEFQVRWQLVSDHFPTLTATPDQIGKLRQTVLQLAVQGKLTRQDPQDEPALVLLRRICTERERLVKEKRLKHADLLPPINPDEMAMVLPSSWTWARLDDLLLSLRNGIAIPPSETGNARILRISALRPNFVNLAEYRFLPEESSVYEEFKIEAGDLLFTRYSGNRDFVGICGVVPPHTEPFIHPDKLIRGCLIKNGVIPEFAALAINTGVSRSFIERLSKTTAGQVGVAGRDLKLVPVPVPPLEEQKRIVAAVNSLMALCDKLEAGLRQAEEDGEHLLRAAVRSLLTPALDSSVEVAALAVQ